MATRDRNDDLARHFGENLRRGRRLARMSQEEPACRAALHRTEVSFSELPRSEIQRFVDELLATGLAPSTVRNRINRLQAIHRHAVRRDVVTVSPTRDVELPAERGRRDGIATAAEAARLIAALPASDRPIWATASRG